VRADFKGPPDYGSWLQCFTVYMVAMIMLEQVLPPWLQAYIDTIAEYNTLYGPRVWAFLYQTDVRFRSEHLPYMSIRESDLLDAAIIKGTSTDFDTNKPWDHLWHIASSESTWWYREFERKIPMLLDQGMGRFIGGDARVSSNVDGHFATSHNATNIIDRVRADTSYGGGGGNGKKKSGGGGAQTGNGTGGGASIPSPPTPFVRPSQPLTSTKPGTNGGSGLCMGYNQGQCQGNGKCPANPALRHLCHWCLGNHPAPKCDPSKKGSGGAKKKQGKGGKGGKGGTQ